MEYTFCTDFIFNMLEIASVCKQSADENAVECVRWQRQCSANDIYVTVTLFHAHTNGNVLTWRNKEEECANYSIEIIATETHGSGAVLPYCKRHILCCANTSPYGRSNGRSKIFHKNYIPRQQRDPLPWAFCLGTAPCCAQGYHPWVCDRQIDS